MVSRRHEKGSSRLGAAILLTVVTLCATAVSPYRAAAQSAQPVQVEPSFATALIRDVLSAVNHGNWTGNYTVLRDYAAPEFREENDPTKLAGLFLQVRAEQLDLLPVMVVEPVILSSERSAAGNQMRLVGYFPLEPRHVSFDLVFEQQVRRWLLIGISVGAFDPITPAERGQGN